MDSKQFRHSVHQPLAGRLPADSGMDLRGAARQDAAMVELQWCQLAVVDLLGAAPVFRNWAAPLAAVRLAPGAVQLWLADLDRPDYPAADWEQLLSVAERARAARFHFPIDQRRFIIRRALLRQLVAGYSAQPAAAIALTTNPFGKPQLATPAALGNLQFNLSVAHGRALYGFVWNAAIGVDLVQRRAGFNWREIAASFFHPTEAAYLRQLPPPDQAHGFDQLWTLKEALVKARGSGLTDPVARTDFSPLLQHAPAAYADSAGRCWQWASWEPATGAVAAVAVEQ